MSKKSVDTKVVDTKVSENHVADERSVFVGKTDDELKEIAQTLQTQLQHHQTMAIKAQGAIEVVLQMLPEEEKIEG
jgi:hypothetical protein